MTAPPADESAGEAQNR